MSSDLKQTFRGVTRAIFSRLRRKASKSGIHVTSPVGKAVKDGVRIQWNYDATSELLEVECSAPFWIDPAQAHMELRREIENTLRSGRAA